MVTFAVSKSFVCAGVVLAAGNSSRFGKDNKLLASYRGEPVIVHAVKALKEAGISPIFVVTGFDCEPVGLALRDLGVQCVYNERWMTGIASSVALGVKTASDQLFERVLITLGDLPDVSSADIIKLVAASDNASDSVIRACDLSGQGGHPVIVPRRYYSRFQQLAGDNGARALLGADGLARRNIVIGKSARADIDTIAALKALTTKAN